MSAMLHVLAPGFMTTVQDLGRPGYQRLGISPGGALDPIGLRAANALVGNPPEAGRPTRKCRESTDRPLPSSPQ
jgi:hypothetical protein